jgi:hypothetical protein
MQFISNHNRLLQGGVTYTSYSGGDMWVSGLEYSGDKITGYSGSAFGGSTECPCDSAVIVDSAYNKTTAWVNEQEFITAHQDVSNLPYVQNSALDYNGLLISGISGDGLYALSAENAFTAEFAYNSQMADSANYAQTADSANVADYAVLAQSANVAGNITGWEYDSNNNISGFKGSAFAGGGTLTGDYVESSALNMSGSNITGISGYSLGFSGVPLSSESGVYITKRDNTVVIGYSGGMTGEYVENSALKLTGTNITGISSYEVGYPRVPVVGSGTVTVTSGTDQVIINGEGINGVASIFTGGTFANKAISSIDFKQAGGSDSESIAFNYSGGSVSSQLIPMTTEAGFLYCPGTGRRITTANPDYKYVPITTASAGATIYITSYPNEVITFVTMGDNVNTGVDTTATIVGPFASITMESGMWVTFSRYFTQSHGLTYAQLGSGWIGGNYI